MRSKRRLVFAGLGAVALSGIVNGLLYTYTTIDIYSASLPERLIAMFFGIAINEEFFKVVIFMLLFQRVLPDVNEYDLYVYVLSVSAIFAAGEGISTGNFHSYLLLVRIVTFIPFHLVNGITTAFFISRYLKNDGPAGIRWLFAAWLVPAVFHAIFKFGASLLTGYFAFIPAAILLPIVIYGVVVIKRKYFNPQMVPMYRENIL